MILKSKHKTFMSTIFFKQLRVEFISRVLAKSRNSRYDVKMLLSGLQLSQRSCVMCLVSWKNIQDSGLKTHDFLYWQSDGLLEVLGFVIMVLRLVRKTRNTEPKTSGYPQATSSKVSGNWKQKTRNGISRQARFLFCVSRFGCTVSGFKMENA